jgi:hypothetical protein
MRSSAIEPTPVDTQLHSSTGEKNEAEWGNRAIAGAISNSSLFYASAALKNSLICNYYAWIAEIFGKAQAF